jgi:hypothetical protein
MDIEICKPYHAVLSGTNILKLPDRKSVFKVYYLSVVGRDAPQLYEWPFCALSQTGFEQLVLASAHAGIGFITAFPSITKLFRFSPQKETVLDVSVFHSETLRPLDMGRGDGWGEFACLAEAEIAAAEYGAWAKAATVEDYLNFRCPLNDFPVGHHAKLRTYWNHHSVEK